MSKDPCRPRREGGGTGPVEDLPVVCPGRVTDEASVDVFLRPRVDPTKTKK